MNRILFLVFLLFSSNCFSQKFKFGPVFDLGNVAPQDLGTIDNSYTVNSTFYEQVGYKGLYVLAKDSGAVTNRNTDKLIPEYSYKLGIRTNFEVSNYFSISAGVLFNQIKYQQNIESMYDVPEGAVDGILSKLTNNYLAIPIQLQFQYPVTPKISFGLGLGPELLLFLSGRASNSLPHSSAITKVNPSNKLPLEDYLAKEYSQSYDYRSPNPEADKINYYTKPYSINILISPYVRYKIKTTECFLSLSYTIGLTDIAPDTKGLINSTTNVEGMYDGVGTFQVRETTVDMKAVQKLRGFSVSIAMLFGKMK